MYNTNLCHVVLVIPDAEKHSIEIFDGGLGSEGGVEDGGVGK